MTLFLLYTVSGNEEFGFYSDLRRAFSSQELRQIAIDDLLAMCDDKGNRLYCWRTDWSKRPEVDTWLQLDEVNLDELY